MFKKWTEESAGIMIDDNCNNGHHQADSDKEKPETMINKSSDNGNNNGDVNTILKGSKLVGDINVTCDLKLSGDVEGNITSEGKSDIVIQGICKGNIITKEGSVDIEGELLYREYISISKGAKLEAQISQVQNGLKVVKDSSEQKVAEIKASTKEIKEVK